MYVNSLYISGSCRSGNEIKGSQERPRHVCWEEKEEVYEERFLVCLGW